MPALHTYPVFICHDWEYSDDYHRVHKFLSTARNFEWEDLSVPEHDPLDTDDMLKKNLRDQIRPGSAMIVLAGMYTARSGWMDWEMAFARRIGLPILGSHHGEAACSTGQRTRDCGLAAAVHRRCHPAKQTVTPARHARRPTCS